MFYIVLVPNQNHIPLELSRERPVWPDPGARFAPPAHAPLMEVAPAAPGDVSAATGFALACALIGAKGVILWAFPEHLEAEHGPFYAEGLAQFGVSLDRLLLVRAPSQADALWAAEQALALPGAFALCSIAASPKGLSLTASRRLLLLAEKNQSHCILARFDAPSTSAAWARFSVQSAPSEGAGRELGAPAFDVRLTRNRTGPSGQNWRLIWNAHDHSFTSATQKGAALDGDLAAAALDRSAEPLRHAV